jgi:hypothetical protein
MRSISFLSTIWKYICEDGDYVFLSTKSAATGTWKDHSLQFSHARIRGRLEQWFKKYSPDKYDIYFCPLAFKEPYRRKSLVKGVNLLWSDIDSGNPNKLKPTFLWESSPGRLQGIWFMEQDHINPTDAAELNKALAYYLGADKGGWDLTQVLRVPGTKNHKYDSLPEVRVIDYDRDRTYAYKRIAKRVGLGQTSEGTVEVESSNEDANRILSKYRRQIPSKVKRLLAQNYQPEEGKRSDIIWYLENKLSESGLSPEEIITLIKHSVWNKYKGRSDEAIRLKTELEKIIESKVSPDQEQGEKESDKILSRDIVVESLSDLMSSMDSSPGWLVDGFWMKKSHGIIAGEPKSFKSTLAIDLAVSVASGKNFLGEFEVQNQGPVVYIQNENAKWIMKDRIAKIMSHKGLKGKVARTSRGLKIDWAPEIPLFSVNQQNFLLSDPMHQKATEQILQIYKPEMLILDPFYLMFDGDINSQKELYPVLDWLIEIRYTYNCAIVLVHHWNKGSGQNDGRRGGQRILGSNTLHGWIESGWYLSSSAEKTEDDMDKDVNKAKAKALVTIEREFRGAGLHPKLDVNISMGEFGTADYGIGVDIHRPQEKSTNKSKSSPKDLEKQVINSVKKYRNGMKLDSIVKYTGISKKWWKLFNI